MEQIHFNDAVIERVEKYINNNCGITIDELFRYTQALIQKKRFDEANNIIDSLLKDNDPRYTTQIARLLLYSFRIEDALNVLNSKKDLNAYDLEILGKCYMKLGFLDSAKYIFNKALERSDTNHLEIIIKDCLLKIYNAEHYNAYVERDYKSFVKNGKQLNLGHVVNLRNIPEIITGDGENDENFNLKTFMIWKIEDNDIYLIPLTSKIKGSSYIIREEDYPNVGKNRCIRDSLCKTTKDNVLSVVDRINNKDFNNVKYNLFLIYYFNKNRTPEMCDYIREISYGIDQYDIVDSIDLYSKERSSYFVESITDEDYITYKIDFFKKKILDFEPVIISKDSVLFGSHVISRMQIFDILEQLKEHNELNKKISI